METKELLRRVQRGDSCAFEQLYNLYCRKVYNFSKLYLKSEETINDAIQSVFLKIWENREMIDVDGNFDGLLFIITRNIIFSYKRRVINRDAVELAVIRAMESGESLDEYIEARELKALIDLLVGQLPENRQKIFNMSRNDGLTHREIAEKLGIPVKNVENNIGATLKYLKKNIIIAIIIGNLMC